MNPIQKYKAAQKSRLVIFTTDDNSQYTTLTKIQKPTTIQTMKKKKNKKITIREYAKERDIDLTRYFLGENLDMPMQSYLKKIGLPGAAKVLRILKNEEA